MVDITLAELKEIFNQSDMDKESTEYSFASNYMYSDLYDIKKCDDLIFLEYKELKTIVFPIKRDLDVKNVSECLLKYMVDNENRDVIGIFKDIQYQLIGAFNDVYLEECRDLSEYIYDAEGLRGLKGKKYTKKRNHLNYLLSEYKDRIEYRKLESKEEFDDCKRLLGLWNEGRKDDSDVVNETIAINKIFNNYEDLKEEIKIGGVYIDNNLEAFTIGSKLNNDMALIHIEKANIEIRGLYQYINKEFLLNEFPDVSFVNREDDMGLEGLREAKMSYHPIGFIHKYLIKK